MKRLILIAFVCSLSMLALAKGDGESRTTTVNVSISSSDRINIQAKYTELTVETWNKNEIEIEATVRYDGKMTDKIQEFLDQFETLVNDNISKGTAGLSINSDLDFPNRGVKKSFFGLVMEINLGDFDEAKLEYKIKAPGTNSYTINNSYEDVRLIGSFKDIDFTQYSGDLEAETIQNAKMNLKYGSASIRTIGVAEMQIYEQELDINEIDELTINTKYSDHEFNSVGAMKAESYESDFQIRVIDELKGDFKYGEITIEEKLGTAEMTLYEVDIEAKEIASIRLKNSKYSKFDMGRVQSIVFEQSYEDETEAMSVGLFKSLNSKYGNHAFDELTQSLELNAYEDEVKIDRVDPSATKISVDGKYIDLFIGVSDIPFFLKTDVKYGKVEYDEDSIDIKRYIKDGDQLEIEAQSKKTSKSPLQISVKGYEVDVVID
ncbi:hypothetical protein [Ekhidna lutea]|nr:hypothetical protein [Ekhidna lutea]